MTLNLPSRWNYGYNGLISNQTKAATKQAARLLCSFMPQSNVTTRSKSFLRRFP